MSGAQAAAVALGVASAVCLGPPNAAGAVIYTYRATPSQPAHGSRTEATASGSSPRPSLSSASASRGGSTARAPSGPPLAAGTLGVEAEDTSGVPSAEGDQLVENGLSSPLCKGSMSGGLSSAAQSNCETSSFVGAPAPTNDYDLDVHIDVGTLGLSSGGLLSVVQDIFIAPVWEALVWVVHALVVMLQWCYTLELLGGSTMSGVASSLRQAQASFTQPWLVLVLVIASLLALYNGLIRRRVAETLGQALLTIAMMAIGLWVIADPLGTIGLVGQWTNQASLGTLGAVAQGTPVDAPRTLGDSMRALFAGAIEVPWCYMEFGNVRWCSDSALLEPRLRKAASSIVASKQAKLGCQVSLAHPPCSSSSDASALTIEHSDELVREANTNGALFLAFPANLPERNSVKDGSSLLHVLCQSEDDTKCEGPTAAQAEFRSDSGTFPRMIGVVLIAVGVLGMTMLFGLIVIHLLAAAVLCLFMLLLAPFAVLAPALGDGGRAVFTGWLTRLLGAVSSKLIFSFVLGALLTMQRLLTSLEPLGWWTQWLLMTAFWWTVFLKRHQAMALVRNRGRGSTAPMRYGTGQRTGGARQAKEAISHPVRWAKGKLLSPVPADEQLDKRGYGRRAPTSKGLGGRVGQAETLSGQAQDGRRSVDAQTGQHQPTGHLQRTSEAESTGHAEEWKGRVDGATGHIDEATRYLEPISHIEESTRHTEEPIRHTDEATRHFEEPTRPTDEARLTDEVDKVGRQTDEATRHTDGQSEHRSTHSSVDAPPTGFHGAGDSGQVRDSRATHTQKEGIEQGALPRRAGYVTTPGSAHAEPTEGVRSMHPMVPESTHESGKMPRPQPTHPAPDTGAPKSQSMSRRSSSIMDDAREVAARRKRQLGFESPAGHEPSK